MVRRILRSMFAIAIDAWGPASEVDMAAHNEIALDQGADVGYRWFA